MTLNVYRGRKTTKQTNKQTGKIGIFSVLNSSLVLWRIWAMVLNTALTEDKIMLFKTRIYRASFKQYKQNVSHTKWPREVTIVRLHSIFQWCRKADKAIFWPVSFFQGKYTGRPVNYMSTRILLYDP